MQRLLWSLAFGVFCGLISRVNGAVFEAKSVSLSDVQAAIRAAKDGDTVTVPAGTATWTSTLNITNNITLQGAGAASTIIVDDVPQMRGKQPRQSRKIPPTSTKQSVRKTARPRPNAAMRQKTKPGGSEGNGPL